MSDRVKASTNPGTTKMVSPSFFSKERMYTKHETLAVWLFLFCDALEFKSLRISTIYLYFLGTRSHYSLAPQTTIGTRLVL